MSSLFLPTLTQLSNKYLVSNDIQSGIMICFGFILFGIVVDLHRLYFMEPHIRGFRKNAHQKLEKVVNQKFQSLYWNQIRDLEKEDIDRTKNNAKGPLMYFIDILVRQGVQLFPFIGYTLWLFYFSPISVLFYIVGITCTIYWYPLPLREINGYHQLWDRYYFLSTNQFSEIIHHRGIENSEQMAKIMADIEQKSENDGLERAKYFDCINMVFNLIFGANLVLFVRFMTNISEIMTYLQYSFLVRNDLNFFGTLYKQYREAKKNYDKLEEILMKRPDKEIVDQIMNFDQIKIQTLTYAYPKKITDSGYFELVSTSLIPIECGQIIRLDGDSGNGKSTFMDIVCGIVPYTEYHSEIYFDGIHNFKAFDATTSNRIYAEQFEKIAWKPSVYEIVSNQSFDMENNETDIVIEIDHESEALSLLKDENLVWKALLMAKCDDFLKLQNDDTDKKWIHAKNINPSGGQKGRIGIARNLYRMMKYRPKMMVLDEVDKSIQSNSAVQILSNVFDFCKQNRIICMVAAHSTEVKNMDYDLVLSFDKGKITCNNNSKLSN